MLHYLLFLHVYIQKLYLERYYKHPLFWQCVEIAETAEEAKKYRFLDHLLKEQDN